MYQKTLHISLFGAAEDVASIIRSKEPYRNFSHDIVAFPAFDAEACMNSDVSIIDASAWEQTEGTELLPGKDLAAAADALSHNRGGRFWSLIVIATKEQTKNWGPDDFAVLNGVWIAPLSSVELASYFENLQRVARVHSDMLLSERYLNTLIDSMPNMVWIKTLEGIHLKVTVSFVGAVRAVTTCCIRPVCSSFGRDDGEFWFILGLHRIVSDFIHHIYHS